MIFDKKFFAESVTESILRRISYRKKKQSRKGQAELTAQPNKLLFKSKEPDNMANREEKIKNINAGLELMSDEELDQVAGGTYNNTAADTRALNAMGFNIAPRSAAECFWMPTNDAAKDDVAKVFSKFGVSVDQAWGATSNRYYHNGNEITRQQAFQIVADATGKPLPELSY